MKKIVPTIKPTIKQQEAWNYLLDRSKKYIFFGGGAGGGKSWMGAEWLMTNCYIYPETRWFIGREELSRLMKSSYVTFQKVCKHHGIPPEDWKLNGQYNYIEFKNGSRIDLLDLKYLPSDPFYERFGSLEYTGGWLEEVGEVHFGAFDVLKSRVGRHLNKEYDLPSKLLCTFNPKKNWLYQQIYKPYKEGQLADNYALIQALYKDNPYTADDYGMNLSEIRDEATKQRLMFGNWEYDDDPNSLIEYGALVDLFSNKLEEGDTYITADIARYGQDKTVIAVWRGFKVIKVVEYQKQGLDVTADKITALMGEYGVKRTNVIVDEDGVGGGVVDSIRGIKGFVNNSSALLNPKTKDKENYRNLKTQCYYMVANMINERGISIDCSESQKNALIEEFEQVKSKDIDKEGKLQIISKEEVKEALGRSPDYSDAIMMRMYFELSPRRTEKRRQYKPNYSAINYYRK